MVKFVEQINNQAISVNLVFSFVYQVLYYKKTNSILNISYLLCYFLDFLEFFGVKMKKYLAARGKESRCIVLFLIACLCLFPAFAYAYGSGLELATAVSNRPDGDNAFFSGIMALLEKDHKPRIRQLITFRLDEPNGNTLSLLRFKKPVDIKDTGLLTIDYALDKESDQWIFLPAVKKSRRISSKRKGGRFVGSDIFYEDLRDRRVGDDVHRIIKKEKLKGMDTIVLESVPKSEDNSVYDKRISWVHSKTLIPVRVDFYQNGESKPVKRSLVTQIEKKQGFWTIIKVITRDLKTQHETHIQLKHILYDQKSILSELFTKKYLDDPQREKEIMKQLPGM